MTNEANQSVSVIILSRDEEANIQHAICSVNGWSDDVHIVDSGSTDKTIAIARNLNANIHEHEWNNWADQRNWALATIDLKYNWVLFLDADEQLTPESREDISKSVAAATENCNGFYLNFIFYFLGHRIRNAMCPHLRLIRKGVVTWRVEGAREYCSAPSNSPSIKSPLIHHDQRPLSHWINKQIKNAEMEADALFQRKYAKTSKGTRLFPNYNGEFKLRHRLRHIVQTCCPPFIRPLFFFIYCLFVRTDWRDGLPGLVYAILFGFWYPMTIDVFYVGLLLSKKGNQ